MTEYTESHELSPDDVADLAKLYAEPDAVEPGDEPSYHTILEVWRAALEPSTRAAAEPVTPRYALKILGKYEGLTFADVQEVHDLYFAKIEDLKEILADEIASDPEALSHVEMELDKVENRHHYLQLLTLWQQAVLQWELEWDTTSPTAAVELAAAGEVSEIIFGSGGLVGQLEAIGFEFDEEDQAAIAEVLVEQRDRYLGRVS